ncbi:MAG: FliM/FliN family flagellar motor C-terminal domain-containing protein [Pseudomonadota bacterium]
MSHDVLRRMVSPPPPAPEDVPISSTRAMRLAVTRAADKTHDMPITVSGMREEVLELEAMLALIDDEMMLVGMVEHGVLQGVSALDLQLRSALIEVQTIGLVLASGVDDRPATGTDAMMAEPLLNAILKHLTETTPRTPLEGWGFGLSPQGQVESKRAAGLILPERPYRVIQMTIDLQVDGRQGALILALPDHVSQSIDVPAPTPVDADWTTRFQAAVNAAPVRLAAELHRFKAPLHAVQDFAVDQVIPLTGCDVTSVKLRATDGRKVVTARLGQSGGMRAVRIEQAAAPNMDDLAPFGEDTDLGLPMLHGAGEAEGDHLEQGIETDSATAGGGAALSMTEIDMNMPVTPDDIPATDEGFATITDASGLDETGETARMLDEMEAAIAAGTKAQAAWDEEASAAAPLDWSAELGSAVDDDPTE